MMRYLLIVPLLTCVYCCPEGYEDIGNSICYRTYTTLRFQRDAEWNCEFDEGQLVQPQNAFVDSRLRNEAQTAATNIWLGLTCLGNTTSSCTYSNGDQVTNSTYTNFYPGHPNPSLGNCVYLSITGAQNGKWLSGQCEQEQFGYGCQMNVSERAFTKCGSSYTEFNDYCYKALPMMSATEAEAACQVECGHLTSIHSEQENNFILNVSLTKYKFHGPACYFNYIGLKWLENLEYEWMDGSTDNENYNNFGYVEPMAGSCVALAWRDRVVNKGEWINTQCDTEIHSVCKRFKRPCTFFSTSSHQPFSVPSSVSPTDGLPACPMTFLTDNGTIYSPGYPDNAPLWTHCQYMLSVPHGFQVAFALNGPGYLFGKGSISLYESLTAPYPTIWNAYTPWREDHTWFASSGSKMRIDFWSSDSDERWSGNFAAVDMGPSGCNQGILNAPGRITSPNHPGFYPSGYSCTYQLQAPVGQRIEFFFQAYDIIEDQDELIMHDGPDSHSPILNHTYWMVPWISVSTTHQMFLTFHPNNWAATPGFVMAFTAV